MVKVILLLFAKVYETFTVAICITLTLTFIIGQRQIQIYHSKDFRCLDNNNVYPIGHRLRDNHVYYVQMVCIRIYDFQKLGQYHELQHRRVRHWMAFNGLRDGEKWRFYRLEECNRRVCNALYCA